MKKQSLKNKKAKQQAVLGVLINVATIVLSFISAIPGDWKDTIAFKFIAIIVLIAGFILMVPFLRDWIKQKPLLSKAACLVIAISPIGIFIVSLFLKSAPLKDAEGTNITNVNSKVFEKNNQMSVDLTGNKNVASGNGNRVNSNETIENKIEYNGNIYKGDVYNGDVYLKPPQRIITARDQKLLCDTIPDKNSRIRINYVSGSPEAANFANQIFKKLTQLGYNNLSIATIEGSTTYLGNNRINIRVEKNPDSIINLTINSQS